MRYLLRLFFLIFTGPVVAQECQSLAELKWLAGSWQHVDEKKKIIESWQVQSNGELIGGADFYQDKVSASSYEKLRIIKVDGDIFYLAKPKESTYPVAFKLSACANNRFDFINQQHDFPQKISYYKQANNRITVDVTDLDNKGFSLTYVKQEK